MISAKVVAHSVNDFMGRWIELLTYELTCPKWMVAEINTDRMKSRNSASSRAIPTKRVVALVESDPFIPTEWHYAQAGMTPAEVMTSADEREARRIWLRARDDAIRHAKALMELGGGRGAAKEHVNRLLEPFMWTTIVITATEWENWFELRDSPHAQLEFRQLAQAMRAAHVDSVPIPRLPGRGERSWHLPYVTEQERRLYGPEILAKMSARRCAAVSYRRQGEPVPLERELLRCDELIRNKHWSPLEMPCKAMTQDKFYGPMRGWMSYRKHFAGESGSKTHGSQFNWPM